MQNNMVSIPSANMNGGLKAANSSGTVVGVGVGVAGTVLTNAQRVYLTPASSFHLASRQTSVSGSSVTGMGVGVVGNAKVGSNSGSSGISIGGGSNLNSFAAASTSAAGTVRYFSQFSKLQPVQQPQQQQQTQQQHQQLQLQQNTSVGQRKLLNGDTMVLVNGNKPLIFATPVNNNNKLLTSTTTTAAIAATTTTTVPNGNRVLINKQQQQLQIQKQLQQQQQQQPGNVIDELELQQQQQQQLEHDNEDVIEVKQEEAPQQQLHEPLPLASAGKPAADQDAEPELDIVINNVVCSFSVRCHLKLREIALNGSNVEYRRENGMVTMKLRRPYTTASIWSSGRITCTGATSEAQAKIAARRYARCLAKLGFPTHFQNFRIVNVLGTCSMPWAIKIVNFSERHRENASYEPELHPGVTYKMREPKATLKIFSTGSITVTAASVNDVESAIQHIYPLVHEFRKQRSAEELQHLRQKQRNQGVEEPSELDDQLAAEAKNASRDNMFVNTTTAHSNAIRPPEAGANALTPASVYTMRRLEQYKSYQQMQEQTQTERRHVTFTGYAAGQSIKDCSTNSTTTVTNSSSSSTTTSDNICANARRRATECWATKLQNKRPRYNDPGSTSTTATGTTARTANTNPVVGAGGAGGAGVVGMAGVGVAGGNNVRTKPTLPDVVLKQGNSRIRGGAVVGATIPTIATTTTNAGGLYTKRETFSPTDFQVDDLIEEDDDDDMDMHF